MASLRKAPHLPFPFVKDRRKREPNQQEAQARPYPSCNLCDLYAHRPSVLTAAVKSIVVLESLIADKEFSMKSTALVPQPKFGAAASASCFRTGAAYHFRDWRGAGSERTDSRPDAVDYQNYSHFAEPAARLGR